VQRLIFWVAAHPWRFVGVAALASAVLIAIESVARAGATRFWLFPYPSADPASWWRVLSLVFRAFPLLATAVFVIPLAAAIILLVARYSGAHTPGA